MTTLDGPSAESPGVVIGNHTNKYVAKNPAIRFLTERWVARLDDFLEKIATSETPPKRPLEVGAGEGVISQRLYTRFGEATAIDLPDSGLRAEWASRPGPRYLHADAERLPFRPDEFDRFPPTVRTLRAFIASYHELLHLVSDAVLPNPDLKPG